MLLSVSPSACPYRLHANVFGASGSSSAPATPTPTRSTGYEAGVSSPHGHDGGTVFDASYRLAHVLEVGLPLPESLRVNADLRVTWRLGRPDPFALNFDPFLTTDGVLNAKASLAVQSLSIYAVHYKLNAYTKGGSFKAHQEFISLSGG